MNTTWSQRVEALDSSYDIAIEDAMADLTERNIVEDDDPEIFWHSVWHQVQR